MEDGVGLALTSANWPFHFQQQRSVLLDVFYNSDSYFESVGVGAVTLEELGQEGHSRIYALMDTLSLRLGCLDF